MLTKDSICHQHARFLPLVEMTFFFMFFYSNNSLIEDNGLVAVHEYVLVEDEL